MATTDSGALSVGANFTDEGDLVLGDAFTDLGDRVFAAAAPEVTERHQTRRMLTPVGMH